MVQPFTTSPAKARVHLELGPRRVVGGGGDHCAIVGAEGQRRDREAGTGSPPPLARTVAQQRVGGYAAADDDLGRGAGGERQRKLFQQGFDDRLFERGGKVRPILIGDAFTEVAEPVEQGRLEATEAVLEAGQGGARQTLAAGGSGPRHAVQGGTARLADTEHPRRLVEGLAGGIV